MAAKIPASDGRSFEERVNEIIDRRLQDPTRLPSTYRAWLPKFIETQDIRLPISQVQGLYLTETNTTALGGDVHGRIGMVRAGSSPYDFIQVTYDAVYGKWVSDPILATTHLDSGDSTSSTTYVDTPNSTQGILVWSPLDTAGLTPQFRLFCVLGTNNASHAAAACIQFTPIDSGGTTGTAVNDTSFEVTTTSTSAVLFSNWATISGSVSLDEYLLVEVVFKIANAASTATLTGANVWVRWVSQ